MENKNALDVITNRSLKIILVEDDYVDQKSFIKTLSKLAPNYEITAVETVAEAFEKIDNEIFDIIVTDYFLPDGTGLDIISKYQNHLSIFITGSDQIQTAIEAMKTGARDYLVKDYNLNYLNMAPMVIEKIYENYQATIRAAEAERTYKELFEKAHDMIQSVDGEGRFIYVNPAWEEALGYTQEEAVNIHFLDIVHPDYHDHCNLIFKQIMNGEQLKGVDIKFISKTGKIVIVEGNITPKILYNNVILSSMSIFRDITEKKLAEEKLHQINEELEIKVSERTLELQQLNKNLATSNFELDTFLYRSSHNLMGPVARFEGLINLLGIPEGTIEKEVIIEKFHQNTDEMKKMITKLTDVSRISGYKNEDSQVNISELTNQILEQLKPDTMFNFQLNIPEDLSIYTSEDLLRIILSNLLENSIRFKKPEIDNPKIEVIASKNGDSLIVTIKDNGFGIKEEYFKKVFDMFFQGTDLVRGNGLGLYLVQKSVDKLQGKVSLSSKLNEWTNFEIVIPNKNQIANV